MGRRDVGEANREGERGESRRKDRKEERGLGWWRKQEAHKLRRKAKGEEVYLPRVQSTSRHFLLNSSRQGPTIAGAYEGMGLREVQVLYGRLADSHPKAPSKMLLALPQFSLSRVVPRALLVQGR